MSLWLSPSSSFYTLPCYRPASTTTILKNEQKLLRTVYFRFFRIVFLGGTFLMFSSGSKAQNEWNETGILMGTGCFCVEKQFNYEVV